MFHKHEILQNNFRAVLTRSQKYKETLFIEVKISLVISAGVQYKYVKRSVKYNDLL